MQDQCSCESQGCSSQGCDSAGAQQAKPAADDAKLRASMGQIKNKILVLSGKGGVGKSTVAANLAMSLAKAGNRVGLLDVDLHGPSIPGMLGLTGQRCGADDTGAIEPVYLTEKLAVISVAMMLDSESDAVVWRGPLKYSIIKRLLEDTAWGELDYLVVDSPPGTGDEPLSVAQLAGGGSQALIVTTPQQVAIADVRRSISFCRMLNLPVLGLIENMSGMICGNCGERVDMFGSGGGAKLAAEMDVELLGAIPIDPQVAASGDRGMAFVDLKNEIPAAGVFAQIVEKIVKSAPAAGESASSTQQEKKPMKIAIPTANQELCMHFGHCEQFAIVDVDAEKNIGEVNWLTPPPHEPGLLPRWLGEQGANMIIAGGMGVRAQELFTANGIEVVVGVRGGTPQQLVADYLAGSLEAGDNVCDH